MTRAPTRMTTTVTMKSFHRAFTLIELIVVIGIIALLVALIIPSLAQARFLSRRAVCGTHARGLSQTMQLYISEWNSLVPTNWPALSGTPGLTGNVWAIPLRPYGNTEEMRQCPEVILSTGVASLAASGPGSYNSTWGQYYLDPVAKQTNTPAGAFAINDGLSVHEVVGKTTETVRASNLKWMRETSNVPTFADAIWSEVSPKPADPPPISLYSGSISPTDQMGRVCIARHHKAVNVAFFDDHVESTALRQLWTLNWTRGWKPPATLPVIR
jgi:prepilin-type N-terminal cleavage/methylation domain-containing protein